MTISLVAKYKTAWRGKTEPPGITTIEPRSNVLAATGQGKREWVRRTLQR